MHDAERSHWHRGFSPVIKTRDLGGEPFERFLLPTDEKPLETVQESFRHLNHRAEATVPMRSLRVVHARKRLSLAIYENGVVNFRQTGDGTSATCPVALSRPVFLSRRKVTMLSEF